MLGPHGVLAFSLANAGCAFPLAHRHTCVIDGNIAWISSEKIRLLDIARSHLRPYLSRLIAPPVRPPT